MGQAEHHDPAMNALFVEYVDALLEFDWQACDYDADFVLDMKSKLDADQTMTARQGNYLMDLYRRKGR